MPNLVGIHDPSASRADLERDLGRMMRAVDLPAFPFTRRTVVDRAIACGNVLTGVEPNLEQPARDPARGVWLMLDGEILNAPELILELERLGHARPSARLEAAGATAPGWDDAAVALHMYLAYGPRFFERLNGQWNLVLQDPREDRTILVSDRLGSRLLYYAEDGERLVFSSEMKGVVAGRKVPTRPGGMGLFQLLHAGTHVGDRTWLEGVSVFPPGTVLELSRERRRERYWHLHFREGGPEATEDAYAEGFARRLRLATERCMRHRPEHPVAITLSGGLDSRAVALAIDRAHLPLTAITYGAPESPDVLYARELAKVIGLDHLYIEELWPGLVTESSKVCDRLLGPSRSGKRGFYSAQLDRVAWRSEALGAIYGLASTIWHPLYRRHMRVMLNGACGDAMTGSHLTPNLLLEPTRRDVVRDLFRRTMFQDRDLVKLVAAPDFYARMAPDLEGYFEGTFEPIDADEAMALANVWDMENRQRRGTFSSFTIERYFCTDRSPFLDYELVDHLARVPGRWRFQQRIYKRMLVKHFPEAKHVPWAYTRGRITASPTYEFLREVYNFGVGRAKRLLPVNGAKGPHWSFRDEVTMLREDRDLAFMLEDFVRSDRFPSDVLSREGVLELSRMFERNERAEVISPLYSHLVGIAKYSELVLHASDVAVTPAADPAHFGVDTGA